VLRWLSRGPKRRRGEMNEKGGEGLALSRCVRVPSSRASVLGQASLRRELTFVTLQTRKRTTGLPATAHRAPRPRPKESSRCPSMGRGALAQAYLRLLLPIAARVCPCQPIDGAPRTAVRSLIHIARVRTGKAERRGERACPRLYAFWAGPRHHTERRRRRESTAQREQREV
jgi:hypothetical protein